MRRFPVTATDRRKRAGVLRSQPRPLNLAVRMLGLGLPAGKDGFVQRGLLALLFASLLAGSSAGVGGATSAPARVPPSDYLVANLSGDLRVLDQQGKRSEEHTSELQ